MTGAQIIRIVGYERERPCDHCGRPLVHAVATDVLGVIGADCFNRLIKADPKKWRGGKPGAPWVRNLAKLKGSFGTERLERMGYRACVFEFELEGALEEAWRGR